MKLPTKAELERIVLELTKYPSSEYNLGYSDGIKDGAQYIIDLIEKGESRVYIYDGRLESKNFEDVHISMIPIEHYSPVQLIELSKDEDE